jgi:DNA-binding MarR family transcriptional regulator
MAAQQTTKAALAADAWRAIFDFIVATAGHRNAVLAHLGLTPNDSRAIAALDREVGRTMRALSDEWECDASTTTWIVDRLEAKGLAERRAHPTDRRVRLVALTPRGEATKAEMIAQTYTPPPELFALSQAALAELRDAVIPLNDAGRTAKAPVPIKARQRSPGTSGRRDERLQPNPEAGRVSLGAPSRE